MLLKPEECTELTHTFREADAEENSPAKASASRKSASSCTERGQGEAGGRMGRTPASRRRVLKPKGFFRGGSEKFFLVFFQWRKVFFSGKRRPYCLVCLG